MLKTVVVTEIPAHENQTKKCGQVNFHFGQVKIILIYPQDKPQNKLMSNL